MNTEQVIKTPVAERIKTLWARMEADPNAPTGSPLYDIFKDLNLLVDEHTSLVSELERVKGEKEKYREALGRVNGDCPYGDCSCRVLHRIAREALADKEEK